MNELTLEDKILGYGYVLLILLFVVGSLCTAHHYFGVVGVVTLIASTACYMITWFEWELNGGGLGYPYPGWTKPFYSIYHSVRCSSYDYCREYAGVELRIKKPVNEESDRRWRESAIEHAIMLHDSWKSGLITPTVVLVLPIVIAVLSQPGYG
jgi:hypothetical protein